MVETKDILKEHEEYLKSAEAEIQQVVQNTINAMIDRWLTVGRADLVRDLRTKIVFDSREVEIVDLHWELVGQILSSRGLRIKPMIGTRTIWVIIA